MNVFYKKYSAYVEDASETFAFSYSDIFIFLEPGFKELSKELKNFKNGYKINDETILQEFFWDELINYKKIFKLDRISGTTLLQLAANFYENWILINRILDEEIENAMSIIRKFEDKGRTFPKEFMRKIKEIETTKKPKPTQVECIILANKELNIYNSTDLLNQDGFPTQFCISIRDSYKSQKKDL